MARITLSMSVLDAAVAMANGNPGAAVVLSQILGKDPQMGLIDLCHLDDMEIYGSDIWLAYKDVCGEDIDKLIPKIRDRSIKRELDAIPAHMR